MCERCGQQSLGLEDGWEESYVCARCADEEELVRVETTLPRAVRDRLREQARREGTTLRGVLREAAEGRVSEPTWPPKLETKATSTVG